MKKALTLSAFFIALVFLAGCTGSSGVPQGTQPEKVDDSSSKKSSQEEKKEAQKTFKLGEDIKLGDYAVTVTDMEDPFKAKNEFMQPEAGNKLVAIEVKYENNTSDKSLSYNPFDWKLYDSEGYSFDQGMTEDKEPELSSGTLNPGGKVRGWVTFETPEDSEKFKLQFTPDFWSSDNVEIQLY
ncbi:MAG: DUF4352 domain-containing protein [Patescibacteria group bacterium]